MLEYLKINNHFKKYLPIFMIMLSLILLMGTSYALLRSSQVGEETYVMNVGLLEVTFQDSETNALTVENMVPVTDQEGMETDKELVFTVKNTGTLLAKYNIYIEETSTSPEFKSVIRFISNKNNEGYNNPKTLSENSFIDQFAYLDVGESATYKVKVWLAEEADATYMNKTFTARIVIDVIQGNAPAMEEIKKSISKSTCNPSVTDDDGTIYLSGTNDCVNFNYVWYSGKLWRITALYPDGTMKMITDGAITTIAYGSNNKFYTDENTTSYMYQWLNQEFLPTLYNHENIIVEDATWNASPGNGTISSKLPVRGQEEVLVNASVGLLNSYEYYKSYQNTSLSSGYLNIGYFWFLLNPYSASSSGIWYVGSSGSGNNLSPSDAYGGRPSIYLKSGVQLIGGTGTESNPYRIKGDQEQAEANVTLINTRQSGEYVNFDEELYRIIGVENETTKLIKDDYVKDESSTILTKAVASSTIFGKDTNSQTDNYWDYYLNKTWKPAIEDDYEKMLVEGIYYTKYFTGDNYKNTVCATVSNATSIKDCDKTGVSTWSGYVGLPRYGEMFASQTRDYTSSNAKNMWLITPNSSSKVWYVPSSGIGNRNSPSGTYGGRPTINLKSEILIESGSGIKSDPYEIKLVETTETEEVQE
ncbi:MAG: hypothetical protein IJ501_04210 [Bacilli bacterium]|nr:hypothetical protein [Bacilli bacterium]